MNELRHIRADLEETCDMACDMTEPGFVPACTSSDTNNRPIRGQHSGHVITLDQLEASSDTNNSWDRVVTELLRHNVHMTGTAI